MSKFFSPCLTPKGASLVLNDELLGCSDTFNENTPPTDDPTYISTLGSAVYKAMSKADKDAVWLMQVCCQSCFDLISGPWWLSHSSSVGLLLSGVLELS